MLIKLALNSEVFRSHLVNQDSALGIVIRYGLDGPVIESKWEQGFLHPSKMPWGLLSLL